MIREPTPDGGAFVRENGKVRYERPSRRPINRMTAAIIGWGAVITAFIVVVGALLLSQYA